VLSLFKPSSPCHVIIIEAGLVIINSFMLSCYLQIESHDVISSRLADYCK